MNARISTTSILVAAAPVLLFAPASLAEPPAFCSDEGGCKVAAAPETKPQTTCPIMGGKINKEQFVDVKGYRIYVCCAGCIATVKENPEKAIAKIKANGETPELLAPLCKACGAQKGSEACKAACAKPAAKAKTEEPTINTAGLATLLRAEVPFVLLDARTGKYDDGRRIPGAESLSPEATAEQAAELIETKDTLVVTYCANLKCPASHHLAARLAELGYRNVIEYPFGIDGWAAAGHDVVKTTE